MSESAQVTLDGIPVGTLRSAATGTILDLDAGAAARWGERSTALSLSLPLSTRMSAQAVDNFFGGFLPEGSNLTSLARVAQTTPRDVVGLLGYAGRDLPGAIRVRRQGQPTVESTVVDATGIRERLEQARTFAGGVTGGGGSLPGYQPKTTLTRIGGRWLRPGDDVASTHILKPLPLERITALHAEDYTLALGRALGLTTFDSSVESFEGQPALIIERYDRRITESGTVELIHQEDVAQALGLTWHDDSKFESRLADGSSTVSLRDIAALLDTARSLFSSGEPDRERLLRYAAFNVAVGNTDAHAKNFSLLHDTAGRVTLAPLYDAAPQALDYNGRRQLALLVGGQMMQPLVTVENLVREATSWGISPGRAAEVVASTLDGLIEATRTIPADPSIAATVPGYIRGQAQNLVDGRMAQLRTPVDPGLLTAIGTPQARDPQ